MVILNKAKSPKRLLSNKSIDCNSPGSNDVKLTPCPGKKTLNLSHLRTDVKMSNGTPWSSLGLTTGRRRSFSNTDDCS